MLDKKMRTWLLLSNTETPASEMRRLWIRHKTVWQFSLSAYYISFAQFSYCRTLLSTLFCLAWWFSWQRMQIAKAMASAPNKAPVLGCERAEPKCRYEPTINSRLILPLRPDGLALALTLAGHDIILSLILYSPLQTPLLNGMVTCRPQNNFVLEAKEEEEAKDELSELQEAVLFYAPSTLYLRTKLSKKVLRLLK